ncbi:hypothetical protein [Kocuria sabuli]|uniref:hypothetical protein n=1 Tax=Kocuria sabuli TaxID=3071448 RepID=UPI0034D41E09
MSGVVPAWRPGPVVLLPGGFDAVVVGAVLPSVLGTGEPDAHRPGSRAVGVRSPA